MRAPLVSALRRSLLLACLAAIPLVSAGQVVPEATGPAKGSPSKWDVLVGYSYLTPSGSVTTTLPGNRPIIASYDAVSVGGLFSAAYYNKKNLGVQVEYAVHEWGGPSKNGSNIGTGGNDDGFMTVGGGLIARMRLSKFTSFVHVLFDGELVSGPYHQPATWGPGITAGLGADYGTPLLNRHLAIRLIQADYEYMHADFGSQNLGGRANIGAVRLSAGFVFHAGHPRSGL